MKKIIGLDVSKNWLDTCVYEASIVPIHERFENNEKGHKALISLIKNIDIRLIVLEPTVGLEVRNL